jgi:DNA-binding NarL/FixJ family response regulator
LCDRRRAVDGLQAVVLAKKFTPDIAVVDISMPGLERIGRPTVPQGKPPNQNTDSQNARAGPILAKIQQTGVHGYLPKSDAPKRLPLAIDSLRLQSMLLRSHVVAACKGEDDDRGLLRRPSVSGRAFLIFT